METYSISHLLARSIVIGYMDTVWATGRQDRTPAIQNQVSGR